MSEDAPDEGQAASSPALVTDTVTVHLNGQDVTTGPKLSKRPADSASKGAWVDYAVDLGAERAYLTDGGDYHDPATGETTRAGGLTKAELIALCNRLGG